MNYKVKLPITLALLITGAIVSVHADTWSLPEKSKYFAPNKRYYFEVTPKKVESQLKYFEDKSAGRDNAGAAKGETKNRAKGEFYALGDEGQYSKKWEFALLNEVSPVSALVSNDGGYVVTFDNWHAMGYGDEVVVIYRSNGALVKKFGLEDLLTKGDIKRLPKSISSIHWGGKHYIDDAKGILILKVVSNGQRWLEDGAAAKFQELGIELATGRPLEPKRDLLTQPNR